MSYQRANATVDVALMMRSTHQNRGVHFGQHPVTEEIAVTPKEHPQRDFSHGLRDERVVVEERNVQRDGEQFDQWKRDLREVHHFVQSVSYTHLTLPTTPYV